LAPLLVVQQFTFTYVELGWLVPSASPPPPKPLWTLEIPHVAAGPGTSGQRHNTPRIHSTSSGPSTCVVSLADSMELRPPLTDDLPSKPAMAQMIPIDSNVLPSFSRSSFFCFSDATETSSSPSSKYSSQICYDIFNTSSFINTSLWQG